MPDNVRETIVIAEDSPPNRKILAHLLQKMGYAVVACEDGQEAWTKLTSGRIENLAAIISDIMMPTMDGIQLLRNVRALCANTGLFSGFRLLGSDRFFGIGHVISFGGDYRDHMNCSAGPKMQVNSGKNRDRRRFGDGAAGQPQMAPDGT